MRIIIVTDVHNREHQIIIDNEDFDILIAELLMNETVTKIGLVN